MQWFTEMSNDAKLWFVFWIMCGLVSIVAMVCITIYQIEVVKSTPEARVRVKIELDR